MKNLFILVTFGLSLLNVSCSPPSDKELEAAPNDTGDTALFKCFDFIPQADRKFLYAAYFVNTLDRTYIIFDQVIRDNYIQNRGLPQKIIFRDSLALLLYTGYEELLFEVNKKKTLRDFQFLKVKYGLIAPSTSATTRNLLYVFLLENGIVSKFEGNQENIVSCFYDLKLDTSLFIPPKLTED